jgi:hypothetical protein
MRSQTAAAAANMKRLTRLNDKIVVRKHVDKQVSTG